MAVRDDFSLEVKRTIAARVNNICSNPSCRAPTSGPQIDPTKALNVGVASHITAASPEGPRYNPSLTRDERRHANNAIWLCQTCGKLIDNDETRFTEKEIRGWKERAEAEAFARIGKGIVNLSEDRGKWPPFVALGKAQSLTCSGRIREILFKLTIPYPTF